ncbi:helix-turn-helix transcriptional regulator [Intestinirhabdus alba]|jgi:DNA-binding NarL/FixJ family response regulator|uniref:LuxR family transcriptional regulator n=1 Tax=Intestinirhabdus alba TaxID=2899544 RepID=A0A6L6IGL8_9ENTR|nr:helix-turn-helix transcriptional regulator [Intestinirhabdus alba]MTH44818.1 LuxR family transcriptional regulator [Intestinirhabdus alba]
MLMYGHNNFFGRAVSCWLNNENINVTHADYQDTINPSADDLHHTMLFNIIDERRPSAEFVRLLNNSRHNLSSHMVVIIADSAVVMLCIELLSVERTLLLSEKSSLNDYRQLTALAAGFWDPRLWRSQKKLTEREQQILRLLASGYSAQRISSLMGLSYKTIQTHKMKIITKLGLLNSAELNQTIVRFNPRLARLS